MFACLICLMCQALEQDNQKKLGEVDITQLCGMCLNLDLVVICVWFRGLPWEHMWCT